MGSAVPLLGLICWALGWWGRGRVAAHHLHDWAEQLDREEQRWRGELAALELRAGEQAGREAGREAGITVLGLGLEEHTTLERYAEAGRCRLRAEIRAAAVYDAAISVSRYPVGTWWARALTRLGKAVRRG